MSRQKLDVHKKKVYYAFVNKSAKDVFDRRKKLKTRKNFVKSFVRGVVISKVREDITGNKKNRTF